jgi:hypothetical protein
MQACRLQQSLQTFHVRLHHQEREVQVCSFEAVDFQELHSTGGADTF